LKWLEPSLEDMLKNFKDENVIIYPLSFIVDNSETILNLILNIEKFHKFRNKDYKVCKCVNDSDNFIEPIKDIIK
jgi:ferrochelatase